MTVDAKGGEKELGVAAVSLEKLLEKGVDHALGAVAVKDAKGADVGKLTVAISALSAVRAIDAESGGGEPAAPAAGAAAATTKRAQVNAAEAARARHSFALHVGAVSFRGRLQRSPPTSVSLGVDFLGLDEARSHVLDPRATPSLDFDFAKEYDTSVGAVARDRLLDALASNAAGDSCLLYTSPSPRDS